MDRANWSGPKWPPDDRLRETHPAARRPIDGFRKGSTHPARWQCCPQAARDSMEISSPDVRFCCSGQAGVWSSIMGEREMALDTDRIDEAVLALLYLGLHGECRAWKGFDWDAMDRLHKKGMIENPVSKAKSVVFTTEGLHRSQELFEQMFKKKSVAGSERA